MANMKKTIGGGVVLSGAGIGGGYAVSEALSSSATDETTTTKVSKLPDKQISEILKTKLPTVLDKLEGTELPFEGSSNYSLEELTKDWNLKVKKAETEAKDSTLKNALKQQNVDENKKRKALQEWCKQQFDRDHTPKINSGNSASVLDEIKELCTLTNKEKFEEQKSGSTPKSASDDSIWKKNVSKLDRYSRELIPDAGLLAIKDSKDTENKHSLIKNWCDSFFKKGYRGYRNSDWQVANEICLNK